MRQVRRDSRLDELVAHLVHGHDERLLEAVAELAAQVRHVRVDRARRDAELLVDAQISSSSSSRETVRPRCSIRYFSSSNSLNDSATCLPDLWTSRGSNRTSTSPNVYVVVAGAPVFMGPRATRRFTRAMTSLTLN